MLSAGQRTGALIALVLGIAAPPALAERTVLVIGDSLSREYQFEFPGFENARNWVELLAVHRGEDISFGDLGEVPLPGLEFVCDIFGGDLCDALGNGERPLMRYRYNWAIPTFSADNYRDNLTGSGLVEQAFQVLIEPDFEVVDTVVVFIGGNDLDSVYGGIYEGEHTPNPIIRDLTDDLEDIVDYVRDQGSDLEIVLVNVPHVGATPEVKGDHPTDPVKTTRVTDGLIQLNSELEAFANSRGIAYADIATLTIDLLEPDTYCIGGLEFFNAGTESGATEFLWLGGQISQNFHPNTNGQALIANSIIAALNTTYGAGIEPLGNREILESVLALSADMPFADWAAGFGLASGEAGPNDDPEGDGLVNLIEFALDLHPGQSDTHELPEPVMAGDALSLTFAPRDPECTYVRIVGEASGNAESWASTSDPIDNGDETWTVSTSENFLRLRVEVVE